MSITTGETITIRVRAENQGVIGYFRSNVVVEGEPLSLKKAKQQAKKASKIFGAAYSEVLKGGRWMPL